MPDKIEYLKISSLNEFDRNPKKHTFEEIDRTAKSIMEFGFTNPVLIDNKNTILAGHKRVLAAKTLDMEEVPCIRLSHLTEAQAKAYVIADNMCGRGEYDESVLAELLREINGEGGNTLALGMSPDELDQLLSEVQGELIETLQSAQDEYQPETIQISGGEYRVWIDKENYLLWLGRLRDEDIRQPDQINSEIIRRLGI